MLIRLFCPILYHIIWHILIEPDTYPIFPAHVIRSAYRHISCFQFIDHVGVAFDGASIESIDVEEAKDPAAHIKRQYGLRRPECLKRHFLAATRQGEAKLSKLFYIHITQSSQSVIFFCVTSNSHSTP